MQATCIFCRPAVVAANPPICQKIPQVVMGGTLSKWHCRVERIVNITVCLQRREPAFLRFLMFGSKEMEKIKASQDKGALSHFLNVCAHAPSPQLFICQSS